MGNLRIMDNALKHFMTWEAPKYMNILRDVIKDFNYVVDVGAEIGLSALVFKLINPNINVIGYETNPAYCSNAISMLFREYYCREMAITEYNGYLSAHYFIKMDCEGCEAKYLNVNVPLFGFICLHKLDNVDTSALQDKLYNEGYVPVFVSQDWKEVCFMRVKGFRVDSYSEWLASVHANSFSVPTIEKKS